jgi:hypothetical protein
LIAPGRKIVCFIDRILNPRWNHENPALDIRGWFGGGPRGDVLNAHHLHLAEICIMGCLLKSGKVGIGLAAQNN